MNTFTLPKCEKVGCPLDRHSLCARNGCPEKPWVDFGFGGRPGLYDVCGDGEVVRLDVPPDEITTEDFDTAWLPYSTPRATATRWYADELGCKFAEVSCSVEWLRCIDKYEDGRKVSEWADTMWYPCQPDDAGAHKFWRLELR